MKRVVFFVPPAVGGAERVTITIAKLLDKEKYDVTIAIIGKDKGNIVDFIPDYMHIRHIKSLNIWDFVTFKIWLLLKKIKPNIVFCSAIYINPRVIIAAKTFCHISIILRNNIGMRGIRKDISLLVKYTYPYADKIILQTDEMLQELVVKFPNINIDKLLVIANPIDTELIERSINNIASPFDSNYKNYVFVGRIDPSKGLDILIPAFANLLYKCPKSRLYIIGKIDEQSLYYQDIINSIKALSIGNNVIWVGYTKNPYIYEKYADCFVLPSRIEGLPNVIIDAMYLGTPVVATRSVPVIDRLVSPTVGIVVDVDDITALSNALYAVNSINVMKEDYSNTRQEFVELFSTQIESNN